MHFTREEPSFRAPTYRCTEAVLDPAATRALMLFDVWSAQFHYNMHLLLERASASDPWRLRTVVEGAADHPAYSVTRP